MTSMYVTVIVDSQHHGPSPALIRVMERKYPDQLSITRPPHGQTIISYRALDMRESPNSTETCKSCDVTLGSAGMLVMCISSSLSSDGIISDFHMHPTVNHTELRITLEGDHF